MSAGRPLFADSNLADLTNPALALANLGGVGISSTQQTASYSLALIDANTAVEMNASSGVNLTVPLNSSIAFPVGTVIEVYQMGAGTVTLVATGGVTLRTATNTLTTRTQYATVSLRKRATDEWVVSGDLT
jgi:hypothetical protein